MNKQLQPRIFVCNAYDIYGGSYMLYQLGRLCYENFGSPVFVVQNQDHKRGRSRFHYPYAFPVVSFSEMRGMVNSNDLLLCNPTESHNGLGTSLLCKKVMYIQGITSYSTLDQQFDFYVSVSHFVNKYTKEKYGIDTKVIHPFIELDIFNKGLPWSERRNEILVLSYKRDTIVNLAELIKRYKRHEPRQHIKMTKVSNQSQEELAILFGKHKYYLTLTPIEGFGLLPLEAMASGTAVLGFDAYGGKDYFTNDNAFVGDTGDYDKLITTLLAINRDPDYGMHVAEKAVETAKNYTYERFEKQWLDVLKQWIGG